MLFLANYTFRLWHLLLPFLFVARILNGRARFGGEDALQVFLIGFKHYTHGIFPYWGPDVVYTQSQIPGALQGLLISGPLWVWPSAWAPILLLNILSFACLGIFAQYLARRFPSLPAWFPWLWILTSPWSLHYSTHIENPSFVMPIAALFFVAVLELLPFYENKLLQPLPCFTVMGCSLGWIFQLHLSWVLLCPYIAVCFYFYKRRHKLGPALGAFGVGLILSLTTLLPTFWKFGWGFSGGIEQNIVFNWENVSQAPLIAARFISYGTYEVAHFIGGRTQERLGFLREYPWAAPFALVVFLLGIAQIVYCIGYFFKKTGSEQWKAARWLVGGSALLLCAGQAFSIAPPRPHTFLLLYPLAMWYTFHCYEALAKYQWFKPILALMLGAGSILQFALGIRNDAQHGIGRCSGNLRRAFTARDYTFLALRRESILEQRNVENLWRHTAAPTGALHYYTNFECARPWFKPQNIVPTPMMQPGNRWRCKIDSVFPYGYALSLPDSVLGNRRQAIFRANYHTTIAPQGLCLVMEWKQGNKSLHWQSTPIALVKTDTAGQSIQVPFNWPPPPVGAQTFLLYLWWQTPSAQAPVYLEEVESTVGAGPYSRTPFGSFTR